MAATDSPEKPGAGPVTLPLVEEQVVVSKREVGTGRVRVRTVAETEQRLVKEELDTAQVSITRHPVNQIVDRAPVPHTEGDLTIVPVIEEVLVVEKRLLLKEEIHIRHTHRQELVEQPVTLRKQKPLIESLGPDADGPSSVPHNTPRS